MISEFKTDVPTRIDDGGNGSGSGASAADWGWGCW